jgi:L-gulonolactone oxidase
MSSQTEIESLSDNELHRLIQPLKSRQRRSFENWARSYKVTPRSIYSCRTETDVQRLVAYASREGLEIRAFGCGHSPSDLVCTSDILASLDDMAAVLEVS